MVLGAGLASAQSILHVDDDAAFGGDGATWDTAFNDLQDALGSAAGSGGTVTQIWVAAGIYTPDRGLFDRSTNFELQNGLGIYGGFAGYETEFDLRDPSIHLAILSGDLNGDDGPDFAHITDNSYHVLTATGTDNSAILDGFVIQGGNAPQLGGDDSVGGGLSIWEGTPRVVGCRFTHNRANFGGGLCCRQSSPILIRCTFQENAAITSAGAVFNYDRSDSVFVRCTFSSNTAPLQGGALVSSTDCDTTLINCGFYSNSARYCGGGAVLNNNGHATLVNCVFSGNASYGTTFGGGALRNERGDLDLINCTLYGNSAGVGGGVFNYLEGEIRLANCILWGNTDNTGSEQQAQLSADGGTLTLNHCCVHGWTGDLGGTAVFGHDPLLVNPDGADNIPGTSDDLLRTDSCISPCTNAGDDAAMPPDVFDLDDDGDMDEPVPFDFIDNVRVYDGRVDRGAYETVDEYCLRGDFDLDGDVDIDDFSMFYDCMAGPGISIPPPGCDSIDFARADLEGDDDVDLADSAAFQMVFSEP